MTISTLSHIHKLLKDEVGKRGNALESIRKAYFEAIDNGQSNVKCLEVQKENARKEYNKACDALAEFEIKEW